jgi:hypothetical protein
VECGEDVTISGKLAVSGIGDCGPDLIWKSFELSGHQDPPFITVLLERDNVHRLDLHTADLYSVPRDQMNDVFSLFHLTEDFWSVDSKAANRRGLTRYGVKKRRKELTVAPRVD